MMQEILLWFFSPQLNRYVVVGLILTGLGVLLTPFIIGIPIMGIGFSILCVGILISIMRRIPGGSKLVVEFEAMFVRMKNFLVAILREVF